MTFDDDQSGYDVVIVGAGVSGSFIADELARAGLRCVLLEAGAHLDRSSYPRTELDANAELYWGGGVELNADATIGFRRPRVVGGGSVVGNALLDRFDDVAFEGTAEAVVYPVVDGGALAAEIAGLPIPEAQAILEAVGQSTVNVWPGFVTDVPSDLDRIRLEVLEPSTPE